MSTFSYPASPKVNIEELIQVSSNYKKNVLKVLLSILVFILGYFAILGLSLVMIYYGTKLAGGVISVGGSWITLLAAAGIMMVVIMFFVFIIKFLFKIKSDSNKSHVEITKEEHPRLFEFVARVCEETKAPFPKKIVLSPNVNASVFYNSSFLSMFFPVRKNLEIGLGLVSCVNLTEFKAIIAHEFGHFSQSSTKLGTYVYRFNRMIYNLLYDNAGWSNTLNSLASFHAILWFFAQIAVGLAKMAIEFFMALYKLINLSYMSLSREMEFHADSVAVSVTGSKPIISALYRLEFAQAAFDYTYKGIVEHSGDSNSYPKNFFTIYKRNILQLATLNKLKIANELPIIDTETASKSLLDHRLEYKDIWATHPPTKDREKNANRIPIESNLILSSPWELFNDIDNLQQKLSLHIEGLNDQQKGTLVDPKEFIDFFEREEKEAGLDEFYNDYYNHTNSTAQIIDTTNTDRIKEVELLSLKELFTDEILYKLKRHNKDLYDTEIVKNISEGHLKIKRFEFDGKNFTRYYSAEIYEKLKKETEEQELLIKEHYKKIALWFYIQAQKKDQALAVKYSSVMAFRTKMVSDREPFIILFNRILDWYKKDLTGNISEDDLPHLRKELIAFFNDYLKLKETTSEEQVPLFLIQENILNFSYKNTIFSKKIEDPSVVKHLDGFSQFFEGLQLLIENWSKLDNKVWKQTLKIQKAIIEL